MAKNTLKNKIVQIDFWDHVENNKKEKELIYCVVYGKVIKETKKSITVICWDLPKEDDEVRDDNSHIYTIIKKAIIVLKVLIAET